MVAMYQARRNPEVEACANAAARDFAAFLRDYVAERRLRPGDDLITALIAAEAEGDRLDTDELIATCVLLLNAGHEATVHAIGNGVAAILGAGLDAARLFADPAATAATVEEVLRFDPPLHLFTRFALADVEVFGHRFRTGDTVGCLLAAANRDPARFPDPGRFDPRAQPVRILRSAPASISASGRRSPGRARHSTSHSLRPPAGTRAGLAAGLRRPLPLPWPRRASAHELKFRSHPPRIS